MKKILSKQVEQVHLVNTSSYCTYYVIHQDVSGVDDSHGPVHQTAANGVTNKTVNCRVSASVS
jgi:hypothetical protein